MLQRKRLSPLIYNAQNTNLECSCEHYVNTNTMVYVSTLCTSACEYYCSVPVFAIATIYLVWCRHRYFVVCLCGTQY